MIQSSTKHIQLDKLEARRWLEISLIVDPETADAVAEVLGRINPAGVSIEPVGSVVDANFPDTESAANPGGSTKLQLRSFLEVDSNLKNTLEQIERELWPLEMIAREWGLTLPKPDYRYIANADWMAQWKSHYRPLRVGSRLLVVPAWLQPKLEPNDVPVIIDPGQAFGTGAHPTTQQCLANIEKYVRPGDTVLDLGCGSGILAIAALKLGASHADGFDPDTDAIIAARKNARSNNVTDRLMLVQGSLLALKLRANYRMTVVNLLSRQIIAFLNLGLTQTIAPGGIMILAGILEEQELEVRSAIQNSGMKLLASEKAPDTGSSTSNWVALITQAR